MNADHEQNQQAISDKDSAMNTEKRSIAADRLETVKTRTTRRQKIFIVASIIVLLAIAFSFENAAKHEDTAAQKIFSAPAQAIIHAQLVKSGLALEYGMPKYEIKAKTKKAQVQIIFPRGPVKGSSAEALAKNICSRLARLYVEKGYMPRGLDVRISSILPSGGEAYYGTAVYDGNLDQLFWKQAGQI